MINIIVSILLSIWALWMLYVFTMGLYRLKLKNELKGINLIMGWPIVILGFVVDIIVNIVAGSLIFLDPPKELLMTSRLKRYVDKDMGWRNKLASSICINMLDIFDPKGKHC